MLKYNVRLVDCGYNKLHTIKALRTAFAPMSLYDAKTAADCVPITIARDVDADEVTRIRRIFDGVATLEVLPISVFPAAITEFASKSVSVVLPVVGPQWVAIKDLKIGEVVTVNSDVNSSTKVDLRLITARGVTTLDGVFVGNLGDEFFYQRLPGGTKITITV